MANAIIVAGLGYGDEGKGAVVSFLADRLKPKFVIRYNGGAQAAHNVVTPDGRHHTFSQFGSGTFSGCQTILSKYVLISPRAMLNEATGLNKVGVTNPLELMNIEREALVTTPFHVALNKIRETRRGQANHGSCGMGIFETVQDSIDRPDLAIRMKDMSNLCCVAEKLDALRLYKFQQAQALPGYDSDNSRQSTRLLEDEDIAKVIAQDFAEFSKLVNIVDEAWVKDVLRTNHVIFEGAQGVLLDEDWGFFPYVTRSKTTFDNAIDLLVGTNSDVTTVGVTRSYMSRHGVGPFVSEDARTAVTVNAASDHNKYDMWQQAFRVGFFDLVALNYSISSCMTDLDMLAVTHLDKLQYNKNVCVAYTTREKIDPKLFSTEMRLVKSIIQHYEGIERQKAIAEALFRMKPVLVETHDENDFLQFITEDLEVPVGIVGRGQSWKDYERR